MVSQWQPTPVPLPGNPIDRGAWYEVAEWDMAEQPHFTSLLFTVSQTLAWVIQDNRALVLIFKNVKVRQLCKMYTCIKMK